jgi:hypothetical protein
MQDNQHPTPSLRAEVHRQREQADHHLADLEAMEAESGISVGDPTGFPCPTCRRPLRYFQGRLICPNRDYTSA